MPADFDPRRVPLIGNDLYQVGQVYRIVSQPHGPDPWIAVQGFFAYAPTLIWSLFKPEVLDMAFDRIGRPHKRRRRRIFRAGDVWQLDQPAKGGLRWALFRTAQLTQRIGWYLIIADATTDFLVNWASMAYQWSGAIAPRDGWGRISGGFGSLGAVDGPWRQIWHGGSAEYIHPGDAQTSIISIDAWGPKTFSAEITAGTRPYLNSPGGITGIEILRQSTGMPDKRTPLTHSDPANPLSPWSGVDTVLDATWPPTNWRVFVSLSGGWLDSLGCNIVAHGAPQGGIVHDP